MISMKSTTSNLITAIETNLNNLMKGELLQLIYREELDCIVIEFPYKRNEDNQPTWTDLQATVYCNGAFAKKYKEKDKE